MRKNKILTFLITLGVLSAPVAWSQSEPKKFDQARSTLERWVETRQLVSGERTDWEAEQLILIDTIALLKAEIESLDDQIERAEDAASAADAARERLTGQNDELRTVAASISRGLGRIEARLVHISRLFPETLTEREGVQILLRRIPTNPETTRAGLSERMTNIVGILIEVDKFNTTVTPVNEVRTFAGGEAVQVRTLYLGLGQAFYVDATGRFAGVLRPGPDGWVETPRNELAPLIQNALGVYDNTRMPAFINVPVEIN